MLKFLHIENIAVIERSDIEFSEGFNVLTGETGAGKSIVIDAINAVLGERTSKELIRDGCDTAEVSAVFGGIDGETAGLLAEYGAAPDEDGSLIIRRRLSTGGKGLIKLGDKPVTAAALREIGKRLINIHGQHDNQALLDPEKHLGYIDALADNSEELKAYYAEFKKLNQIRKELQSLEKDETNREAEISLLSYQIDELEKAEIKAGEYETLKEKLEIARNYEALYTALSRAYDALNGGDDFDGAVGLMEQAVKSLASAKRESSDKAAERLESAISEVRDISAEIADFIFSSEYSDIDADYINKRLDLLERLMLKYGNTEQAMLEFLEKAKARLEDISAAGHSAEELSFQLDESTERLLELADKLTATRTAAAGLFEKRVCDILNYLNMPNVRFVVGMKKGRYTKYGCDEVEFLISANEGESVKPLHKIASGGELSRVMLAVKSVLLDKDSVGTMIFDEIDTGISGYTAGKVGVQLKRVSANRQVICVTHLAQIAAMADTHLLIEKNTKNGRTFTKVGPLSYEGRINEIARIMSGAEITENLYNSAKELVDRSISDGNL